MPKPNYGNGAMGALSGAASGAAVGSAVPGIGTAIGAGVGGTAGGLAGLFGAGADTPEKVNKIGNLNPDQETLLKMLSQGLQSGQGSFGEFGKFDPAAFKEGVSDPALKQFQDEILPLIQNKYISNNQIGGSGQQRAVSKAGTELQTKLAQLLYQARQDQLKNRLAGVQTALGISPFQNQIKGSSEGLFTGLAKGAAPAIGKGIGNYISGLTPQQTQSDQPVQNTTQPNPNAVIAG